MGLLNHFAPDDGMHFVTRKRLLVDADFQWRYTGYLLSAVAIATVIAGGTCFYFLNQNYKIFFELGRMYSPDIIENLAREQMWLNTFLISTIIALATFNLYIGLRLTSRIAGPLVALKRHLKQLTRGKMDLAPLGTRQEDEFKDLIESYNYFYKFLQAQTKRDLERLDAIAEDPSSEASKKQLIDLIRERKKQLNIEAQPKKETSKPEQAA